MLLKRVGRFFFDTLFFRVFCRKQYAELDKFKSVIYYETEPERYLNDFQKPGTKHELNLKNFALCYSYGRGNNNFDHVYSDAPYTLVLTYKKDGASEVEANEDEEVACIGFELVNRSTILVKQIQGVSGKLAILQHFRWGKMLLKVVMDWAKNAGFKTVRVIKAESSKWYREYRAKDFFIRYDVTARRSGFKFDEKDQTYVRILA
ncbi:MAG: hypothetical protein AAB941_01000 [Patescibacteria group bacterium]